MCGLNQLFNVFIDETFRVGVLDHDSSHISGDVRVFDVQRFKSNIQGAEKQ